MRITPGALDAMIRHAEHDFPNEACGYLAADANGVVVKTVPMRNVDASPTSYRMDPLEQLKVQRRLADEQLTHAGIYHSHVATPAYPSRRDIANALAVQDFCSVPYLLVTLKDERPRARVFTILDGNVREEPLEEVTCRR
ncbi:MAG: M67 family metallopeptidase [Candidatus Omnitrophica bacterium]|nr:M67 family metallopeptidase [Candidatus Omnitrophota bacterium]